MPRASRNIGLEIIEGLRELKRGEHGRVMTVPSITAVREKTGLSQAKFAKLLGVSVRTLQEWEQGRRAPSGAARMLLLIAAKNPQALWRWRERARQGHVTSMQRRHLRLPHRHAPPRVAGPPRGGRRLQHPIRCSRKHR